MRIMRIVLGHLTVLMISGCLSAQSEWVVATIQTDRAASMRLAPDGPVKADRDRTLAYWNALNKIVTKDPRPEVGDFGEGAWWADRIEKLPVVGVDRELVEVSLVLAREMRNVSSLGRCVAEERPLSGWARSRTVKQEVLETARLAAATNLRLNALRPVLSLRYGIEFPAR
jgi:hypothetical protein